MKPGRNDPCPCGSGRKFKKCCLTAEEEHRREEAVHRRAERARPRDDAALSGLRETLTEMAGTLDPLLLFPYAPEDGPLHDLAFARSGKSWEAQHVLRARSLASLTLVIDAVAAIADTQDLDLPELRASYETLAEILLETLLRRARLGMQGLRAPLDDLDTQIGQEIAVGILPPQAREIFRAIRARALSAVGVERSARDADLDKLRARIKALREKTVDQGCTEEEALAAAEKVAELLDRYGLSLSETEIKGQACDGFGVDTGRKRTGAIDGCVVAVAEFCDCRAWMERPGETIRWIFFGLPADVAGARYLYDMILRAFETETRTFQAGPLYRSHASAQRRGATTSFQTGLAQGICRKLKRLMDTRDAARAASSGRDLIPIKNAVVDDDLEKLGLTLTQKSIAGRARRVLADAFHEGVAAGERFEWRAGLEERATVA